MKIVSDFSQNHSKKSRRKKDIKFIVIHYTGMQSEIESIKRLKNKKTKVSCHYLINRSGTIIKMVNEDKVAWHAGKSKWKNFVNLNKNSIGIELVNRGHAFGYESFSNSQIKSLINLCKKIKKKYKIKNQNFLGHSDIAPLRKKDPGEKFPWKKISKYGLGFWRDAEKKILNSKDQNRILFFKNIHKIGYRYFNLKKRNKRKDKLVTIAFQRRYNPNKVSGNIDKKTYILSHFLANH